ncbi:MAG: YbbR domain-containing protein [Polaribacter sp.]|jgi:YbbR domain-containing protein
MIKRKNKNKIPKAFSVALLFAVLFWLLIKMSKEYKTVISFPVEYVNIPQNKLIQKEPVKKIDIQIKASGFRLFGLGIVQAKIKLDARKLKRKSGSDYYFLLQNQKIDIQHQITNKYMVDQIVEDTVYLNLGTLTSKMVPVYGNFDLSYKLGYHLIETIKITPDSIMVSGPEEQIDTLQRMQLEQFFKEDISETIETTLKITESTNAIKFKVKEVTIYGEVDQFTEGKLEVPFRIINMPDSVSVNTFPTTLKVIFQVGLSNFNKVNSSSFKIVCDYQQSINNNLNYLIPRVIFKPDFVTSVKLTPAKVEFLIQR